MKMKKLFSGVMATIMTLSLVVVNPIPKVSAAGVGDLQIGTKYEIISKASGKALTVAGYSEANNAGICQMDANQYAAQERTFDFSPRTCGVCK